MVRADLDVVVGRLTQADMGFAPRDNMRTVAGQLQEIAGTETQLQAWLIEGKQIPWEQANDFGSEGDSLEDMKRVLQVIRNRTLAYIDAISDQEAEEFVAMPKGWFEALGREAVPRSEVLRSLAQHEWYHVGQLVSYRWFQGDDPYTWK